jgi:hypothetical protein
VKEVEEVKCVKKIKETAKVDLCESLGLRLTEKRRRAVAFPRWRILGSGRMSDYRRCCRAVVLDFGEGFGAALADFRVTGIFADAR